MRRRPKTNRDTLHIPNPAFLGLVGFIFVVFDIANRIPRVASVEISSPSILELDAIWKAPDAGYSLPLGISGSGCCIIHDGEDSGLPWYRSFFHFRTSRLIEFLLAL